MTSVKDLNGSAELFAKATRDMFEDAFEKSQAGFRKILQSELGRVEQNLVEMEDRLNDRNDTTNKNMQVQFARQEKMIADLRKQTQPDK